MMLELRDALDKDYSIIQLSEGFTNKIICET